MCRGINGCCSQLAKSLVLSIRLDQIFHNRIRFLANHQFSKRFADSETSIPFVSNYISERRLLAIISYGVLFLAKTECIESLLNEAGRATMYGGAEKGYTD